MAAFSSKNSSTSTSNQFLGRPNNPIPRNSEISNPMRRSFSGSPFGRPSPMISGQRGSGADHQRRHSIGRDNVVASPYDYQDKENSKDQCPRVSKSRSPAPLTKDTKNFMSPTISAASKINPSPKKKIFVDRNDPTRTLASSSDGKGLFRNEVYVKPEKCSNQKKEVSFDATVTYLEDQQSKKILADRNDPTRTSVSSSDGKGLFGEEVYVKPEKHSNQKKEVSFDATVTYLEDQRSAKSDDDSDLKEQMGGKDDLDAFPKSSSMENDLVNLDPSFKISPSAPYCSRVQALAPLDADPSVQTPFSESDADPLMPPYGPKTNYLSPRPQFLHYRPNSRIELYLKNDKDRTQLEDYSASECSDAEDTEGENLSENSQKASEEELLVSGSNPINDPIKDAKEETMEDSLVSESNPIGATASDRKRVSKPHFFTKSKLTALILFVAIGCLWLSVSHLPIMDPSVFNNLEFPEIYIPPELADFAKNNLHALTQQLQTRLYSCYSYIINMLSSHRERYELNSLMYANLTTLFEDGSCMSDVILDQRYSELEVGFEGSLLMATTEEEFETMEEMAEGDYYEYFGELEEAAAHNNLGVNETTDEVMEYGDPEHLEEEQEEAALDNPGVNETADEVIECDDCEQLEEQQQEAALTPSGLSMELNWLKPAETGIGIFAIGLLGTLALLYFRSRKSAESITLTALNQVPSIEKLDKTWISASKEHTIHERPASRICHTDMVDLLGDSCPSETSFQSSSYTCRKGLLVSNQVQSQERSSKAKKKNCRRESSASSDYSAGSLSYGSFMTYEKITDNGNGDEQVVTPVRRSSRIRNQVTSP